MAKRWKTIAAAVPLKVGDIVRHYEELSGYETGPMRQGDLRKVRGWVEVGVVVQIMPLDDLGFHDCLVAFVGEKMKHFYPKDFDGARPWILRYYNTTLEKVR